MPASNPLATRNADTREVKTGTNTVRSLEPMRMFWRAWKCKWMVVDGEPFMMRDTRPSTSPCFTDWPVLTLIEAAFMCRY